MIEWRGSCELIQTIENYLIGYLKERRFYNNTTHEQLHSSPALGIDGTCLFHVPYLSPFPLPFSLPI